jgi:hypothetical protein
VRAVRDGPNQPGRHCPLSYRYSPHALSRDAEFATDTLFVIGGLYGNVSALASALDRIAIERRPRSVFNGDFHWFDIDPVDFDTVEKGIDGHVRLRGNVETEIAGDDDGAGCGCAYPEDVSQAEVDRSNEIIARLRTTAQRFSEARAALAALPMHAVVDVAGVRVGVVHGDMESLAGWSYSESALASTAARAQLRKHLELSRVRVVASSHTCLPVALTLDAETGRCAFINNGAAGMPNFCGTQFGLMTRISARPAKDALYRAVIDGVYVEAIPIDFDPDTWLAHFSERWLQGSAAHTSYFERMKAGPGYLLSSAVREGFRIVTSQATIG